MLKKICIFTGSRAEYGLLKPLIEQIKKDKDLLLQIVVSGMHLSADFGMTVNEIEQDGFKIFKRIKILSGSDSPVDLCKSIALGLEGFSKAFKQLKPDIIVILGDRFEVFAAAVAAMVLRIPIAHIHGGESTFGAIDEAMRHSITKMSYLHFVAAEKYRNRVVQLGEDPARVFNVGAIGLDNIRNKNLLSKNILEKELNFKFNRYNILVTFHPVTLEKNTAREQFRNLLDALDHLKDTSIIFTKANADTGGLAINTMIDRYVNKRSYCAVSFMSLGQKLYFSLLRLVDAVVGNSSSGIIEAPSFKIGTVNIGDRQKGRIRAKSIIDCVPEKNSIMLAIRKVFSKEFKDLLRSVENPYCHYHQGLVSYRIKEALKNAKLSQDYLKKEFFDVNFLF